MDVCNYSYCTSGTYFSLSLYVSFVCLNYFEMILNFQKELSNTIYILQIIQNAKLLIYTSFLYFLMLMVSKENLIRFKTNQEMQQNSPDIDKSDFHSERNYKNSLSNTRMEGTQFRKRQIFNRRNIRYYFYFKDHQLRRQVTEKT